MSPKPTSVDDYISQAEPAALKHLKELRACLQKAAPEATEMLKWGKPAFVAEYVLFVYASAKNHVSLHPTWQAIEAFKDQLQDYETSANTIKFPSDKPLPLELITQIAKFRVEQSKQGVKWK